MKSPEQGNCYEIIEPALRVLEAREMQHVQIMGGVATAPLLDARTVYLPDDDMYFAPDDITLPAQRENGTRRDLDVLVITTKPEVVASAESTVATHIGKSLELSFFGIQTVRALQAQRDRPYRSSAKVFLGDRYGQEIANGLNQSRFSELYKSLFPFAVPLSESSLATQYIKIGNKSLLPTAKPGATLLNYATRSISGLRAKDAAKIGRYADAAVRQDPSVREWIFDGPGKPLVGLAGILQTLRSHGVPQPLHIGSHIAIPPVSLEAIRTDPAFMYREADSKLQERVLRISRLKARVLAAAEGNQQLVGAWQRYVEARIQGIIKNE